MRWLDEPDYLPFGADAPLDDSVVLLEVDGVLIVQTHVGLPALRGLNGFA